MITITKLLKNQYQGEGREVNENKKLKRQLNIKIAAILLYLAEETVRKSC